MTIPDYDKECDCEFCDEERRKRNASHSSAPVPEGYIITEEQLEGVHAYLAEEANDELRFAAYDILDVVRSRPYNEQSIRQDEREKVLDEAIKHWENVIEYGKGVSYNHPVTYEWMYRGVVDYLKNLRAGR